MQTFEQAAPLAIEPPPQQLMIESTEAVAERAALVPLSYDKIAWNGLRKSFNPNLPELEHHDSFITPEQAAAINQHYDVELVVGTHGFGVRNKPEDMPASLGMTTQREYQEVWSVIDSLEEGDTLFVEGQGFDFQPEDPITMQQLEAFKNMAETGQEMSQASRYEFERVMAQALQGIGGFLLQAGTMVKVAKSMENLVQAEQVREHYLSSAWTYARLLAAAKGVRVRFADFDYYDAMQEQQRTGKDASTTMMSDDLGDQLNFLKSARRRDVAARNLLKDDAIAHLPPTGTPPPTGRKPKLVLLYGRAHKDHVTEVFDELGLHVASVRELEGSTPNERLQEHFVRDFMPIYQRVMRELVPYMMTQLAGSLPDLVGVGTSSNQPK